MKLIEASQPATSYYSPREIYLNGYCMLVLALKEVFSEFDKNSDGYISKEELNHAMLNFGHNISNEEIEQMIKLVDIDGKNVLLNPSSSNISRYPLIFFIIKFE